MTNPASIRPARHHGHDVDATETIGGVLTDLTEISEQMPVQPDRAEPTARILDRLSEELGEAAGMLRAGNAEPGSTDAELIRLRAAFPLWRVEWVGGPDWAGFTASREGFPRANVTTPAALAARIFHLEGMRR